MQNKKKKQTTAKVMINTSNSKRIKMKIFLKKDIKIRKCTKGK